MGARHIDSENHFKLDPVSIARTHGLNVIDDEYSYVNQNVQCLRNHKNVDNSLM